MTNLETVTDAAREVLNVLGEGYDEGVYEEALAHEMRLRQIAYERQRNFEILYKGYRVGEGRIDFIINPLWAGKGGKELVLELKAVKVIAEGHKRQAQVYMLSLNIDEGAVMNFASEVQVVEVAKPSKARDLAVATPDASAGAPSSTCSKPARKRPTATWARSSSTARIPRVSSRSRSASSCACAAANSSDRTVPCFTRVTASPTTTSTSVSRTAVSLRRRSTRSPSR